MNLENKMRVGVLDVLKISQQLIFMMVLAVPLMSCGVRDTDVVEMAEAQTSNTDDDNVQDIASIVGTWRYTYASTQCIETQIFQSNGAFESNSLDEVLSGSYIIEEPIAGVDKRQLIISAQSDNLLSDCNGSVEDTAGVKTFYVEFPDDDVMNVYLQRDATIPTVIFLKEQ